MTAYYNEKDQNAAAWLRELIAQGHIAPGHVDERSIVDVRPADLDGFGQCHFFAGIGGWSLALRAAGWSDDRPVWTGSCPCQPFSNAGRQGGFDDARHLWPEFQRLIAERRPATIFGEQVASAAEWLRLVRSDLEAMEYAVGAMPIEAASAGADHLRDRFWFVGHDTRIGRGEGRPEHEIRSGRNAIADNGGMVNADCKGPQGPGLLPECADQCAPRAPGLANAERNERKREWIPATERGRPTDHDVGGRDVCSSSASLEYVVGADGKTRRVKSGVRLLVDGFPNRVGLLRGFGNAIDPRPAAAFIEAALA